MTWFSRVNKRLVDLYHQNKMTVHDIRRGIAFANMAEGIRVLERHGGFYLEVTMTNGLVGEFAFGVPTSTKRIVGIERDIDWEGTERMLDNILLKGYDLRRRFWGVALDPEPALLDSLTLRTSTLLLPVNKDNFPVEDFHTAHELLVFQYLISPDTHVLARLSDPIFDSWSHEVKTAGTPIQWDPGMYLHNYGLLITDENAAIRATHDTLYQPKTPMNLRVTDAWSRFQEFHDHVQIYHYLNGLVLVDRIARL